MEIRDYNKEQHMGCCMDKAYKMVTGTISSLYDMTEHDCHLDNNEMMLLKNAVKTLAYLNSMSEALEANTEQHHHA